jgi:hypothetical protein
VKTSRVLDVFVVDEAVDLPVAVAGEVGEGGLHRRLLVEAVDRHDREQLSDGPDVRRRLEDAHVAVVDARHLRVELLDLFGDAA